MLTKKITLFLIMLMLLSSMTACGGSKQKETKSPSASSETVKTLTKVRISYQPAFSHGLLRIAENKGWFKDAGLDVKLVSFQSGIPQIEAMAAGDIDISLIGSTAAIIAAGQKLVDEWLFTSVAEVTPLFTVISNGKVKSIEDLKGKSIIVTVGSSMHYFLDLVLEKAGLTEKDVNIIHMEPSDGMIAFIGGQGDAIVPLAPQVWVIKSKMPSANIIFDGSQLSSPPGKIINIKLMDVATVTKSFSDKNPQAVKSFLDVWFKCVGYINNPNTRDKAIQEIIDWQNKEYKAGIKESEGKWVADRYKFFDAKEVKTLYANNVISNSMNTEAKFHLKQGKLKVVPDATSYITDKFINEYAK